MFGRTKLRALGSLWKSALIIPISRLTPFPKREYVLFLCKKIREWWIDRELQPTDVGQPPSRQVHGRG